MRISSGQQPASRDRRIPCDSCALVNLVLGSLVTLGIGRMTDGAVRVWLRLEALVALMVALWFYAPAAVVVLVIADVVVIRPHLRGGGHTA